jgi:hypothetical protein
VNKYVDIAERVIWTAVQGFCAEWLITRNLDATTLKVAGIAALVSAAKCIVATHIGDSNSAAAIPGVTGNAPAD